MIYHEDCDFVPRLFYYTNRMYICPEHIYYYLLRSNNSITSTFNVKRSEDLIYISKSLYNFINNVDNINKSLKLSFLTYILFLCNRSLDIMQNINKEDLNNFLAKNSNYIKVTNRTCRSFLRMGLKKYCWSIIASLSISFYVSLKQRKL